MHLFHHLLIGPGLRPQRDRLARIVLGAALCAGLFSSTASAQGPGGAGMGGMGMGMGGMGMGGMGGGRMNVSAMMTEGPGGAGPGRGGECLVLYTGATFYGRLSRQGLNYKVAQPNGELVIPVAQVRLVADSAREAYEIQRRGLKEPTVEEVLSLARWCQEQGLRDEARQLCGTVLKVEPESAEAHRILRKVESHRRRPLPRAETPTGTDPLVVTAAGISPGANADFIRRIQPLLINSCGQRGCHSADSDQEFRLSVDRLNDGPRFRSDENLAEALKRITLASPERSPLLVSGRSASHHRAVFSGPGGEECRRQLEAWVVRVALEQSWIRQASQPVPEVISETAIDKAVLPSDKFKLDGKSK